MERNIGSIAYGEISIPGAKKTELLKEVVMEEFLDEELDLDQFTPAMGHAIHPQNRINIKHFWTGGNKEFFEDNSSDNSSGVSSVNDTKHCNDTEENHMSGVIGHPVFLVDQNVESSPSSDDDGNASESFPETNGVGEQLKENIEGLKWSEDLIDFVTSVKNWKRKGDHSADARFRKRKKKKVDVSQGLLTYTKSSYNSKKSQDLTEKQDGQKRPKPCLFCRKFYKNIKRHLINVHKSEELVIRASRMRCENNRRWTFDLIEKRAIEIENQSRLAAGKELITESVQSQNGIGRDNRINSASPSGINEANDDEKNPDVGTVSKAKRKKRVTDDVSRKKTCSSSVTSRRKCNYTKETLEKALAAVRSGMFFKTAARQFGIPRSTIQLKIKQNYDDYEGEMRPRDKPSLSKEEKRI